MAKGGMLTLQFVSAHSSSNSNKIKFDLSLQYTQTYLRDFVVKSFQCLYRPQGKVIFYTCLSVHRRGHAWWGACVVGGHVWWGVCMAGGHVWQGGKAWQGRGDMHGGRHAWGCMWQGGPCMAGGMHGGGGHAWQERQPLLWMVCILLECILV